jgi:threonine/homoserine/homoserine lactone efflux protein
VDVIVILAMWWLLSLTGALAPGPLSAAVVMQASRRGRLHGMLPMVGHAFVELGIVALIILSVSLLALESTVISAMQGFGGIVVILFGGLALRDWKRRTDDPSSNTTLRSVTMSSVVPATAQGIIVSILSPYFLLWWFAIGVGTVSTLIVELQVGVGTVFLAAVLIYLTHISTDFMFGAFLAVGTEQVNKRVKIGAVNWVNVFIGFFQIALGLIFIWEALT